LGRSQSFDFGSQPLSSGKAHLDLDTSSVWQQPPVPPLSYYQSFIPSGRQTFNFGSQPLTPATGQHGASNFPTWQLSNQTFFPPSHSQWRMPAENQFTFPAASSVYPPWPGAQMQLHAMTGLPTTHYDLTEISSKLLDEIRRNKLGDREALRQQSTGHADRQYVIFIPFRSIE
jgi:hypothetical protein